MKITEAALEEVVNLLMSKYPDSLPTGITTLDEIHRRVGQQDVIRFLHAQLEVVGSKSNGRK